MMSLPTDGAASLHLMVVDDDPSEFQLLADGFAQIGIEVAWMTSTSAAMAIGHLGLANRQPDAAIVDIGMPLVSGFTLARQFISDHLPTILISIEVDAGRRTMATEIGALGMFQKPVDGGSYQELARSIAALLGRRP